MASSHHPAVWSVVRPIQLLMLSALITAISGCSSGSSSTTTTTASSTIGATSLYAVDESNSRIDIFSAKASGSAATTSYITIPGHVDLHTVAVDATGQVYAGVEDNASGNGIIQIYPSGASTPSRNITLQGPSFPGMTVSPPYALAVDTSGLVYVGTVNGAPHVYIFAANASGAATPLRTLQPANITYISDLAVDSTGNLYVNGGYLTNPLGSPTIYSGVVDVYSPTANGTDVPSRIVTNTSTFTGIAVDGAGDLYASMFNSTLYLLRFAPGATGAATPSAMLPIPTAKIAGTSNVRLDANGNIFTAVQDNATGYLNTTFYAFPPNFTAATQPIVTFNNLFDFSLPTYIAVH